MKRFECGGCNRRFHSERGREDHRQKKDHPLPKPKPNRPTSTLEYLLEKCKQFDNFDPDWDID